VTFDVRLIAEKRETRFELKRDDLHRAGFEVNRTRARKIRNEWETVAARICALVTTELQEGRIKREKEREREKERKRVKRAGRQAETAEPSRERSLSRKKLWNGNKRISSWRDSLQSQNTREREVAERERSWSSTAGSSYIFLYLSPARPHLECHLR